MLKDLLAVFSGTPVLTGAVSDFHAMLELARAMVHAAHRGHWGPEGGGDFSLSEDDARMNELQQYVRRRIILHLAGAAPSDAEFCLTLMGLVKDVERVGDYAKNLVRLPQMVGTASSVPRRDDPLEQAIFAFAAEIVEFAGDVPAAYADADLERAFGLVAAARARSRVSDALVQRVAAGQYGAATAARMTLTIRFYRRINTHLASVLASVASDTPQYRAPSQPRAVAG